MKNDKRYELAVDTVTKHPQLFRYSAALTEVQKLTGDRHSKSARFKAWELVLTANRRIGAAKAFWEPTEEELTRAMFTRVGYSGIVPPAGPFIVFFKLSLVLLAVGSIAKCTLL